MKIVPAVILSEAKEPHITKFPQKPHKEFLPPGAPPLSRFVRQGGDVDSPGYQVAPEYLAVPGCPISGRFCRKWGF
jgi:hypothetical protein